MRGLLSILLLFHNAFDKSNNTGAWWYNAMYYKNEESKAHIPPAVAIRGCNIFREKTKLSKIS